MCFFFFFSVQNLVIVYVLDKHACTLKDATEIFREFAHVLMCIHDTNKHLPPDCRLAVLTFGASHASPGQSSHLAVLKYGIYTTYRGNTWSAEAFKGLKNTALE